MKTRILLSFVIGAVMSVLAFAPAQGDQLYAISCAAHTPSILYELNPATGAVMQSIGNSGVTAPHHITSLACQPGTGVLYGYVNEFVEYNEGQLATIDISNGLATVLPSSSPVHVPDMTFTPDGTLYGWDEGVFSNDDLVTFNSSTGVVAAVGDATVGTNRLGLASNSSGEIYMKAGLELYTVDAGSGMANTRYTIGSQTTRSTRGPVR